ncbi:MAG: ComF family protein [Candidatus Omnitrophota bacterium]
MLRDFLNGLLNLIYPNHCLLCKRHSLDAEPLILCQSCTDKLEKNPPPFFRKGNYYFEQCFSPFQYSGPMEDLIHLFKYRNRPQLAKPLSQIMIKFMEEYNLALKGFDCLAPIPLHPSKLREREYNQSELLAQPLAAAFNIPLSVGNLQRRRFTQPQSSLKKEARWDNVRGAFAVKEAAGFTGRKILIVDDLLTTGATCNEAARVLKESGAECVDVLTLAIAK